MKVACRGCGVMGLLVLLTLAGRGSRPVESPPPNPDEIQAKIVRLMPATVRDHQGWASDIYTAFSAQQIYPSSENFCVVLAVAEQESTYQVDPLVAGLGRIAAREVECRAGKLRVPALLVSSALNIKSPDNRIYSQHLAAACTEKELSKTFDGFIVVISMGGRLFDGFSPVHIGGPVQVSIAFAEQHADDCPYPSDGSIRHEVFSQHGDMHSGIAHLLDYPVDYPTPLYRFADSNAGWYASRSAMFQNAVSRVSGIPLALGGDLIRYGTRTPDSTELAARSLGKRLGMGDTAIRRMLEQGDSSEFVGSAPHRKVFALIESATGKMLLRTVLSGITLESPKTARKLTAARSAKRVDERCQYCMTCMWKR